VIFCEPAQHSVSRILAAARREREALSWSEVVKSEEDNFLRVEYEIDKELCGKTMHLRSEHLIILSNITRSSCEEYDPDAKRPSSQFQLTRETLQIDQLFHDVIDSRAIFRHDENGNDQLPGDRPSIYRTLDWLLRGHVKSEDLPTLDCVLCDGKLWSLNNRRLADLKLFQALSQETVWVACVF